MCGVACAAPKADTKSKPEPAAAASKPADAAAPAEKPEAKDKKSAPKVTVEKKGSYVYWITYKDADGAEQTTLPQRFKGKSSEIDASALGEKATDAMLYVMNKSTGNMAVVKYAPKDIDIPADEFQYVRNVRLRVVAEDGKPIESAIVRITDGMSTEMTAAVTPADLGVATFHDVASGEVTVKVEADGLRKTLDSDIEVPDKRKAPDYEREIKVAGDVNTLPISVVKESGKDSTHESKGGSGSGLLQTIAVLLILAIIIGIVAVTMKARGLSAQAALQKMGVEMPGDGSAGQGGAGMPGAPAMPAVDPTVCEFCGQKKDAAGHCACSVVPGATPFAAAPAASPGVPRLVGAQGVYSGHIFEITGPSMVMGREAENAIALVNDSTASRRHATISQSNGGYMIRDEGSSNGTFVNGAKVTEMKLTSGDEIQVGGTKFRFEV